MPLHDINAQADFESRKATIIKLCRKNIDMIESDPVIILRALMELTCLYLITELGHLPWKQVRTQSFNLFRTSLDTLHSLMETVKATEMKANEP